LTRTAEGQVVGESRGDGSLWEEERRNRISGGYQERVGGGFERGSEKVV
jgi:hypothetical protein